MNKICIFEHDDYVGIINDDLKCRLTDRKNVVQVLLDEFMDSEGNNIIYATVPMYGMIICNDTSHKLDGLGNEIDVVAHVAIFNDELIDKTTEIIRDRLARGTHLNLKNPMIKGLLILVKSEIIERPKRYSTSYNSEICEYAVDLATRYEANLIDVGTVGIEEN